MIKTLFLKLKEIQLNILFLLFAIIYYLIVSKYHNIVFTDKYMFNVEILKITSVVIIIGAFQGILKILTELKKNNPKYVTFSTIFLIYFTINIIPFMITEGGIYNGDEVNIIHSAATGDMKNPIAHFLTVIYYIISFSILPFQKSATLVHIIIISGVVAYLYTRLSKLYDIKYKFLWLIPFLLPPIIRMNLQGLRSIVYYPFILLLFIYLFFKLKEKTEIKTYEAVLFAVLTAVTCIWRNENIIILAILPFMIKQLFKNIISVKNTIIYYFITILLIVAANLYTSTFDYTYKTLVIKRPLSQILKTNFISNNKEKDLEVIGNVLNIEEYKKVAAQDAIFIENYSDKASKENIAKLFPVFIKLVILNFPVYIKDRIKIIKEYKEMCFLRDSTAIYQNNADIKEKTINILELRNKYYQRTTLGNIFYNVCSPVILLLLTWIYGIKTKKEYLIYIPAISLILAAITCLTCAEQYFHYYIQCYITGYFFPFFGLSLALNKKVS